MGMLEHSQWELRSKSKRWHAMREVLSEPWNGDRGWEGRTIGMHLPLDLRNFAIVVQEKLQLRSMKEVLFKALVIGLKELNTLPAVPPPALPTRVPMKLATVSAPSGYLHGVEHDTDIVMPPLDDEDEVPLKTLNEPAEAVVTE